MLRVKKLKTLLVSFENELPAHKIPAFRGAIVEKVGREHSAFHNHNEDDGYIYQYPVIQYKTLGYRPSLFCVGEGVDEIHNLFGLRNWDIQLQGERLQLRIHKLDLNNITLNIWDKFFKYSIHNWLALNERNYRQYHQITGLTERVEFLERLLVGNILSFAKGIDWHIEQPIKVQIQELKSERMIRYKGIPLMAFDVNFACNVFLPNYLGLGKSASHGFGVVRQFRNGKITQK